MTIFVFLGPTLPIAEAKTILDAIYLPPARTGDVYRVVQTAPDAIAIIDGYFDRVPTVWHKEILWAMKQGIHVFGSSSMGALRAAELTAFGMEGIGQIFQDFHQNTLEDDDEVAVAHASAEDDFVALSVAMVDIRATLKCALDEAVIDTATHNVLIETAKSLFYPQRNYKTVIASAKAHTDVDLSTFEAWLMANSVSQKREDAIQLLETLRERFQTPQEKKQVNYAFQNTVMWAGLTRSAGQLARQAQSEALEHTRNDYLLDELRLNPEAYYRMMRLTLLQLAARYIAQTEGWSEEGLNTADSRHNFMAQRQIREENFAGWLQQNNMTEAQFETYLVNYLRINQLETQWHDDMLLMLPEVLRLSGHYAALAGRANRKQSLLSTHYIETPEISDTGLTTDALYRWYFVERLKMPAPPDDVKVFLQAAGFPSAEIFQRALIREYFYQTLKAKV